MSCLVLFSSRLPSWRLLLSQLALGLCLITAQYAAIEHELSHSVLPAGQHDHSSLPHDELCIKCLSFAHVGHSIVTMPTLFIPIGFSFSAPLTQFPGAHVVLLAKAYLSRAPPLTSD